jgi:hypothetical protein
MPAPGVEHAKLGRRNLTEERGVLVALFACGAMRVATFAVDKRRALLFLICSIGSEMRRSGVMSIEIFVMSDRRLNSMAEWQRAIEQEGFDLRLDASRPFEALHGHLPAWRGSEPAGFECDHWDPVDLLDDDDLADIDFGRRWTQTLAFRIGGDFLALWAALAAATAYARATGGVVFEGEGGEVLTPDKAADMTHAIERDLEEA